MTYPGLIIHNTITNFNVVSIINQANLGKISPVYNLLPKETKPVQDQANFVHYFLL
jgi:hypothetical protein